MNEKLKSRENFLDSKEVLNTLKRIEKHLQDLVFYTTPEQAFIPSAGRVSTSQSGEDKLAEIKIKEIVTQEVKRHLKETK